MDSLLQHPDSRHYRHDALHDLHKSLEAEAETVNPLPVFSDNVTKNLCKSDPIEPAVVTANIENTQEGEDEDCYEDDNSSCVSLTSTIPSSLSTDAPPSIFSFSSYESNAPRILSPDKIDVSKLNKCRVSVNKMAFYSWSGQNKDLLKSSKIEEEKIINDGSSTSDSDVSQMTDLDVLCVSDQALDGNSEDCLDENCADYALDLNELKSQINGAGVTSLMDLHLNIKKILEKSHGGSVSGAEIRELYLQLLGEAFPWFDAHDPGRFWSEWEPSSEADGKKQGIRTQASRDYLVKPSSADHVYASKALKRKLPTEEFNLKKEFFDDNKCDNKPSDDTRKCVLCGVTGDGDNEDEDDIITGRLIPLRFGEWVHVNCALWSSEVYEAEDGSLQNVFAAVTRSKTLQCSATDCHTRGATLGCCHQDCSNNYHLQVREETCQFT